MRRWALLVVGALAALAVGIPPAVATRSHLVFRIDKISASIEGTKLTIEASGAVQTGGWTHPRLKPIKPSASEAPTLRMEFVADPPPQNRVVISALLPIKAEFQGPLPKYGTVAVSVNSQTNEITTQIRRSH